jgi:predicted HicB family RNase H-like nuclease
MDVGRRRKYEPDRVTTAVRIPTEIHQKLQEEAEARDVSLNYLLVRGAQLVLERLTPLSDTEAQLQHEAS